MRPPLPFRMQRGWGTSEYVAVLLGLMAVWHSAQWVLRMLQRHHDAFSQALMIPF